METKAKLDSNRITVEIHPSDDETKVRLSDFLAKLGALKDALAQTERLLYGDDAQVELRVVELGQKSPPYVTIEAWAAGEFHGRERPLLDAFLRNLDALELGEESVRTAMDLPALTAYRNLAPAKGGRVAELRISGGGVVRRIDRTFAGRVTQVVGPDELAEGSVLGALEMINFHRVPRFAIFQTIRGRKVTCNFTPELKEQVIAALERYVKVTGTLHFKKWDPRPHEIDVKVIEVFPDENTLPEITDLAGINPDIIGDMASEEFLAAARNVNW